MNRPTYFLLSILPILFIFSACSKGPVQNLNMTINSSKKLNWESSKPHSLTFCIYQLTQPGAFQSKSKSRQGIGELLQCKAFDTSVVAHERMSFQPSRSKVKNIRRVPGADYLAIVGGFYNSKGRSTRLVKFDNTKIKVYLGQNSLSIKKIGEKRELN